MIYLILSLSIIWFLYLSKKENKFDNSSRIFRFYRRLVFLFGDLHSLFSNWKEFKSLFPLCIGWKIKEHNITFDEIDEATKLLQPGDIILHRDDFYLSNVLLPGAMIHAGIVVYNDKGVPNQIVEAISEGVVKRHVTYILASDRVIVLRPKVKDLEVIKLANELPGFQYDVLFEFSTMLDKLAILNSIRNGTLQKLKDAGIYRFCCTEIPWFLYLEHAQELKLEVKNNNGFMVRLLNFVGIKIGKHIVSADQYLDADGFEIVWCSKLVTLDWCTKMKVSKEFYKKVENYLTSKNC